MKPTRIVELVIQDDNQELAIDAISLVHSPAIESDFVFFGKQKNNLTLAKVDEEKRMLISAALIPKQKILSAMMLILMLSIMYGSQKKLSEKLVNFT
jgi:hypothetical protein